MKPFVVEDLGRTEYANAVKIQEDRLEEVLLGNQSNTLFFTEHDPVITLGAGYHKENILWSEQELQSHGIAVHDSSRGGDVTLHAPGQLIIWPVFSLETEERDLHRYLRNIEAVIIKALSEFGISGERLDVNSGVWVNGNKICAIGIKLRRWTTMHGLALNVSTNLDLFRGIIPCGITTHGVTSMEKELGRSVKISEVKPAIVRSFEEIFQAEVVKP